MVAADSDGLNVLRRALHHQDFVVVLTEMVAMLLVQQTQFAIGRRDADQHAVWWLTQASPRDRFRCRACAGLVAPERHLVEDAGHQRAATNGAETGDCAPR